MRQYARKPVYWVTLAFLFWTGALIYALYRVETVASDTNRLVKVEVRESEKQIADLTFVVDEQAVPAIVHMAGQLQAAGVAPPTILLGPQHPTFAEQQNQ